MQRTKGKPDFVHGPFRARGRLYCYFRRPGCKRVPLPLPIGSGEFWSAYQAALDASAPRSDIGASRSSPGSMAGLIAAFIGSDVSRRGKDGQPLGEETWRKRLAILNKLRDEHGGKPVKLLRREHIVDLILDGLPPHAKRNWVKALRPLMKFAATNGWHADRDLMRDVVAHVPKNRVGFPTWGEEQIETYRAKYPLGSVPRLAMELILNTVQRPGDALRLGPQHVRIRPDGKRRLALRQSKTGGALLLPIVPELQEALDLTPCGHLTFLTTARGEPWSPGAFRKVFRQWTGKAGLQEFSAHGLRKAGCRRLAESGCTVPEIAAWSGHLSLAMVQHYIAAADQAAMAEAAANRFLTHAFAPCFHWEIQPVLHSGSARLTKLLPPCEKSDEVVVPTNRPNKGR
jgi:integrase